METRWKAYDFLRGLGYAQQCDDIIFSVSALSLIVGLDKMEKIVQDINPEIHDSKYLYDILERNMLKNDVAHSNIRKYIIGKLCNQNFQCKDLLQLIKSILYMGEEEVIGIIDGVHQTEINLMKGFKEHSTSDTSWINKLAIQLLKQHKGKTLLNADCGTGTFLATAYNTHFVENIVGYSYCFESYVKASIRAYIKDKDNIKVYQKPFFGELLNNKFDMIYAEYPFNIRYEIEEVEPMITTWKNETKFTFGRKYSSNMLCTLNMLECLNDNGVLISLIPNGGLFNSMDAEIRKYLIEHNYLDGIISLPSGIFPCTGINTSMLILRKNRKNNDNITLIDASEFCKKERRHVYFTDENINSIINEYNHKDNEKICFNLLKEDIIKAGYNLGLECYKKYEDRLVNPRTLESVCEKIFRGYQAKASDLDEMATEDKSVTNYRIVNVSDVQAEGYVSASLKPVVIDDPKKYEKYCLMDGDILITAKNTIVKTAVYKQRDEAKVILTGNLIAIRVNKNKINPHYLKTFLDSVDGNAAIKRIQTGTSVISINPNGLKEMRISLLPLEQQEELAKMFCEKMNEIEELQNRYNIVTTEIATLYDEYRN